MANSINSKLVDIAEKTKDIEEFSEVRKVLTDEEIIFYYIAKNCELSETYDGEERIIKDILKVLVEDTKGMRTKEYIIKRKLMLYKYGIRIKEV